MREKKYKVALVSAGMITNAAHIPAYKNHPEAFELCGIFDIREEAARETAVRHGIPGVYTDFEKMLSEIEPDIVSICTPNLFHAEQTLTALRYGANVICEKPLALKYAQAKEIFDLAKKMNRHVFPCQSMRFGKEIQAAKEITDSGVLGDIYFGEISSTRRRGVPTWGMFHIKERSGGGAFCDLGVHMIDSFLWISGNPRMKSISGNMTTKIANQPDQLRTSLADSGAPQGVFTPRPYDYREFDVEEFAAGSIRFENGLSVNFKVAWALNCPDSHHMNIIGDKSGLSIPDMNLYGGLGSFQTDMKPRIIDDSPFSKKNFNGHWHLIERVLQTLDGFAPPLVTPEEALNVVAIIDGFYRSAEAGREIMMEEV